MKQNQTIKVKLVFRDSQEAFLNAINNYNMKRPQDYMYMHTDLIGNDYFKDIITRNYIKVPNTVPHGLEVFEY